MRFEIRGHPTTPAAAWRLVADTDWLNRAGGNTRVVSLDVERGADRYPAIVGAMAGPLGTRMRFEETDVSWVAGQSFRQVRAWSGSPLRISRYEAQLIP